MPRGGHVVDGGHGRAGLAVEDGQELRAGQDVAGRVAVVGAGVADDLAGAVRGAVGGLHGDLGPAVAVVVVHLELGVVRAGADVAAQVDPPQPGAVQLVRVDEHVAGVAGLGVVLGVGRIPLEHDLVLRRRRPGRRPGVVGAVGVGDPVGRGAAGRPLDRHVEVAASGVTAARRRPASAPRRPTTGADGVAAPAGAPASRKLVTDGRADLRRASVHIEAGARPGRRAAAARTGSCPWRYGC